VLGAGGALSSPLYAFVGLVNALPDDATLALVLGTVVVLREAVAAGVAVGMVVLHAENRTTTTRGPQERASRYCRRS
jgi:hypothetical protein